MRDVIATISPYVCRADARSESFHRSNCESAKSLLHRREFMTVYMVAFDSTRSGTSANSRLRKAALGSPSSWPGRGRTPSTRSQGCGSLHRSRYASSVRYTRSTSLRATKMPIRASRTGQSPLGIVEIPPWPHSMLRCVQSCSLRSFGSDSIAGSVTVPPPVSSLATSSVIGCASHFSSMAVVLSSIRTFRSMSFAMAWLTTSCATQRLRLRRAAPPCAPHRAPRRARARAVRCRLRARV